MSAKIKKITKEFNTFEIKLKLTAGELLSLRNGMVAYGEAGSNVGADVGGYIKAAFDNCPEAKALDK